MLRTGRTGDAIGTSRLGCPEADHPENLEASCSIGFWRADVVAENHPLDRQGQNDIPRVAQRQEPRPGQLACDQGMSDQGLSRTKVTEVHAGEHHIRRLTGAAPAVARGGGVPRQASSVSVQRASQFKMYRCHRLSAPASARPSKALMTDPSVLRGPVQQTRNNCNRGRLSCRGAKLVPALLR